MLGADGGFLGTKIYTVVLVATKRTRTRRIAMSTDVSSLRLLVNRRTGIGLRVDVSTGRGLRLPFLHSALMGKIRVLSVTGPSARVLGSKGHVLVGRRCAVASFSSTLCCLPPFRIVMGKRPCQSGTLTMGMCSVPMSALRPRRFFKPGAIHRMPVA